MRSVTVSPGITALQASVFVMLLMFIATWGYTLGEESIYRPMAERQQEIQTLWKHCVTGQWVSSAPECAPLRQHIIQEASK